MVIDKERVIAEFNLKTFGVKGWKQSKTLSCPYCGKTDRFGFLFLKDGGVVHCFKCDTRDSIFNYLKIVGRSDLIEHQKQTSIFNPISRFSLRKSEESEEVGLSLIKVPIGSKNIKNSAYLEGRNFNKYHYDLFKPFIVDNIIFDKYEGYVFFRIFQEGILIAWLARSKKSKEWHKRNLIDFKAGRSELRLRYENSRGSDFNNMVGGIDEITNETETVIIVEGIFDKVNVDTLLQLNETPEIKCVFTFGNKVGENQIKLIKRKGVKNIVLMYDPKTEKESAEYGLKLSKHFDTKIAVLKDKDPGEICFDELQKVLLSTKTPLEYAKSVSLKVSMQQKRRKKQPND